MELSRWNPHEIHGKLLSAAQIPTDFAMDFEQGALVGASAALGCGTIGMAVPGHLGVHHWSTLDLVILSGSIVNLWWRQVLHFE